jgi:carbonic anhydrase
MTPDDALARLKKGNTDFLADVTISSVDHDRRMEVAQAQAPFAVLVGCSDSRVSPTILFRAGLGELFVVRNAGNAVDDLALGSIEYGVLVLAAPLIVVLGHQRCGAVEAAVAAVRDGATFPGSIGKIIEPVIPAVRSAEGEDSADRGAWVDAAVRENVRRIVERLRHSEPSFGEALRAGELRVVGAEYSLDDGAVDFFLE